MTALPRIGVVVLNWNGRVHLERCLPTLLASDHPDLHVVVSDNGSRDGSVDWLRACHPEVELLALPQNRRFAEGNNAGAERALAAGVDVLVLLNNDTTVDAGAMRALGEAFAADPGLGIAGPRIVYEEDPERIWYGGGRIDRRLGWVRHRALRRRVDEGADPAGPTDWVTGCALAVRAELWRELGGLDPAFYIYAEDVDFCLRAASRGAGIGYVPTALIRHAVSASVGGAVSPFKCYHRVRSRRQLWERHGGSSGRGLRRLAQVAHDLLWGGSLLLQGAPRSALAILHAWQDGTNGRNRHPVTASGLGE